MTVPRRRAALLSAVLWGGAPVLCFLQFHRPPDVMGSRSERIPSSLGEWTRTRSHDLTERSYSMLGTRDVLWAVFQDGREEEVNCITVFHAANWKSVHPPQVCLRGDGCVIESTTTVEVPIAGHHDAVLGRIVASLQGRRMLGLFAFGTRDLLTPSYLAFFLHHVPGALLRRPKEGFLIRVETFMDGDPEAAMDRCLRFFKALLPMVEEAVR